MAERATELTTHTNRSAKDIQLWRMPVYAKMQPEVDPYRQLHLFRDRTVGYTGDNAFWKTPSPEPQLSTSLRNALHNRICDLQNDVQGQKMRLAIASLAYKIALDYSPQETLFVAILRGGSSHRRLADSFFAWQSFCRNISLRGSWN